MESIRSSFKCAVAEECSEAGCRLAIDLDCYVVVRGEMAREKLTWV